ncbi:hypothetical protein ABTH68_19570, partial [Acinetobacter baumannii]
MQHAGAGAMAQAASLLRGRILRGDYESPARTTLLFEVMRNLRFISNKWPTPHQYPDKITFS